MSEEDKKQKLKEYQKEYQEVKTILSIIMNKNSLLIII